MIDYSKNKFLKFRKLRDFESHKVFRDKINQFMKDTYTPFEVKLLSSPSCTFSKINSSQSGTLQNLALNSKNISNDLIPTKF